MQDAELVATIGRLVDEEHHLERAHAGGALSEEDRARLRDLEVALDQCWDLLRQRRGQRDGGQNPDHASVRPEGVVEGYKQ